MSALRFAFHLLLWTAVYWPLLAQPALAAGGYEIVRLGLTGPGYQYNATGGVRHGSTLQQVNELGQAVGETARYTSSGVNLGQDAWFFDGEATHVLGLTGGVHEYSSPNGLTHTSNANWMNSAGHVVGDSTRYSSSGAFMGYDSWLYNGTSTQPIGPTGSEYEKSEAGGVYRLSSVTYVNEVDQAAGLASRYGTGGQDLGNDAWIFSGTSTQIVGLTTGVNQYNATGGNFRYNILSLINDSGKAAGFGGRFTSAGESLGSDTWYYDGINSFPIGLQGVGYEYTTPGGVFRANVTPQAINTSGQVAGIAVRSHTNSENRGAEAFLFDGTTTHRLGLTGAGYEFTPASGGVFRYSVIPPILSDSGWTGGINLRFNATGDTLGQDAWIADVNGTRFVGLSGSGHEYTNAMGVFRQATVQRVNNAGQAVGVTSRYNSAGTAQGQSGWFYDQSTDITTPLIFSVQTDTNRSATTPLEINDDGVVFGLYDQYNGATLVGEQLFKWSQADGFQSLGPLSQLVDGGLAAAGWQNIDFDIATRMAGIGTSGVPRFIAGEGLVVGQVFQFSGGESVYLLRANSLLGDYNNDGSVNAADYTVWRNHVGQSGFTPYTNGDGTGDGKVTSEDYLVWKNHYGEPNGGRSTAEVPEPGSISLLLFGLFLAIACPRWRRSASVD